MLYVYLYHKGDDKLANAILICGMARGRTTAVSARLEKVGIPMTLVGESLSAVKEDLDFHSAVKSCDSLKAYIEKRISEQREIL